ncbi:DinB family protein [Candidatus Bathyarchaeota archaeon]|nr:DinB family protein [Candidatus Bathyarchaeota archaeon]
MSVKAEVLKEAFEFAFSALERTLEGTDDTEYTHRLTEASNDIQSILNHLSRMTNLNIPRIISGDFSYAPEDWPEDYVEHSHGLEKMMADIDKGREKVLRGIAELSDEQLEEVLQMMSGPYPRKIGLYAYLGELFHHRGQIAFIRGTVKRLRERDPDFLR